MEKSLISAMIGSLLVGLFACGTNPTSPIAPSPNAVTPSPQPAASPTASSTASPTASPTATPSASSKVPPDNDQSGASLPSDRSDVATPSQVATSSLGKNGAGSREITVYKLDDQCNGYVPEKLPMPTQGTAEAVVAKVLENSNTPDFAIANYRVDVKNGEATVALRLPTNAKRPFTALSTCEQMSLLGSMEKTLKENSSLNIQAVRFTDGKKELQF